MSKRPSKISEILAKRSSPAVSITDQQDFISETKFLVQQYQQENKPDHFLGSNEALQKATINLPDSHLNTHNQSPLNESCDPTQAISALKIIASSPSPKQDTNAAQTGHEQDTNVQVESTHTGHNEDTNRTQKSVSNDIKHRKTFKQDTNAARTGHNEDTKPHTRQDTKKSEFMSKESAIRSLKGNSAKLFIYICDSLISAGLSEFICSYDQLAFDTKISRGSIETTLKRLSFEKDLIVKKSDRGGIGARLYLSIDHEVFLLFSKYQSFIKSTFETGHNEDTKSHTKRDTKPSSKIDSIYNNTNYLSGEPDKDPTKIVAQPSAQNSSWFKDLDFSQVPIIRPMLVNSAIRKQVESELDRDDVQIFINKFKNWLASQHKIQNPVAIFCEKLKEWCNEGASDVLYALSDEEIEIEKVFALEVEKKRQELALIEKAKSFKLEQDSELKFEAWFKSSTDDEKKELFKPQEFAEFGSAHYIAALKSTYLEKNG